MGRNLRRENAGFKHALELAAPGAFLRYLDSLRASDAGVEASKRIVREISLCWHAFSSWCLDRDLSALPASVQTISAFVAHEVARLRRRGKVKVIAAVRRSLWAIRFSHVVKKTPCEADAPAVQALIRTLLPSCSAVSVVDVCECVSAQMLLWMTCGLDLSDPFGVRDRALLSLGWAAALSSDEIADLRWEDLESEGSGLRLYRTIQVDSNPVRPVICPVASLHRWRALSVVQRGLPVFRRLDIDDGSLHGWMSKREVDAVIQFRATAAGISVRLASDALRVGWVVDATQAHVALPDVVNRIGARALLS